MLIETQRLLLRPLTSTDVDALVQIWTDPDVTQYMGGPRDLVKVRANLAEDAQANPPPQFDLQPVIEKVTGRIVGHCGITEKTVDDRVEHELVYVLAKSAWGKGYAAEIAKAVKDYAIEQIGLQRMIALIDPENVASRRVAEKVGLRYEKETIRPGGKRMHVYASEKKER